MSINWRSQARRLSNASTSRSFSSWASFRMETTADDPSRSRSAERSRKVESLFEKPSRSPLSARSGAIDGLLAEFIAAWENGASPRVEDFLARLDSAESADGVELVYQDYCLAETDGLKPDPKAYAERFPAHRDRLERLLRLHSAFDSTDVCDWAEDDNQASILVGFPQAGDEIGPYRLIRELGRGGLARVFLARQTDLEDRRVVVKIASRATAESRLLARASHPHIVEVISHATTADGAFHLICMPFLGGATLGAVLAERRSSNKRPKTGNDLLADLDRVADPDFPRAELPRPTREILAKLSHPRAVAWIIARLAEALEHAHRQGIAHGDIKPSNILLAADGQPMLFDFNLAVDWSADDKTGEAGGTLGYMAPERLRAIAAADRGAKPSSEDRQRADIYSLGLILLESLTGRPPAMPEERLRGTRALAANLAASRARGDGLGRLPGSAVPASLRPILASCLAADPHDRYDRAAKLADDLDRWRADRAPKHAREAVWRFGPPRWIRRQRLALSIAGLTLLLSGIIAVFAVRGMEISKRKQALDKLAMLWNGAEPGVFRFQPVGNAHPEIHADPADIAQKLLARYDVLGPADWHARDDVRTLPKTQRDDLELWVLEQTWRFATASAERPRSPEDWRRALDAVDRSNQNHPLPNLLEASKTLRRLLKIADPSPSRSTAATSPGWMEDYLRGVAIESLRAKDALQLYQRVSAVRPDLFWPRYRAASAAFRVHDLVAAEKALRACIAERPVNPILHTQLAACLFQTNHLKEALGECEAAIEIDHNFEEAYRARTHILTRMHRRESSASDIERYQLLTRFQGPSALWKLQIESEALASPEVGESKEAHIRQSLAANPNDTETRYRLVGELFRQGRKNEALVEANTILAVEPEHLRALSARATLTRETDLQSSIRDYRAAIVHPRFEELIREDGEGIRVYHGLSRALLLAGRVDEAESVARRGLKLSRSFDLVLGESHYSLALALVRPSKTRPARDKEAAEELVAAGKQHEILLTRWFEKDGLFNDSRDQLRLLLAGRIGKNSKP